MRIKILRFLLLWLFVVFNPGCSKEDSAETTKANMSDSRQISNTADTIYSGGKIITISDAQPTIEAVAVKDGKILAVGNADAVMKTAGENTRKVNLNGKTMLPGFVDSHGHAYAIGLQASTANLLPAPDGNGNSIADLQKLLSDWTANNKDVVERIGWIAGFGYDDSQLAEQRHPTREDLDIVSKDFPVIIIHQSGHLGVANSKALEIAAVTSETKNPKGGVFRRKVNSNEPNGVCEEYAFFYLLSKLATRFDNKINDALVIAGTNLLASYGYTTGQDGRSTGPGIEAMRRVAASGKLAIDLVSYPDILEVDDIQPTMSYTDHFRIGGAKLTIDGSPQGKTAWLTKPYHVPPPGQDKNYTGYTAVNQQTVDEVTEKAYAHGWQILVHANGDAAIDSMISAMRAAKNIYPDVNNRPVLIHGQTLRHDQVGQLKELGIFPSLFPMHTFYWGDWHRDSVLGPERAENISPTGWVLEQGMMFGTHHDAPVALPDSMRVLSATVTRTSRTGVVLGPTHRVPVMTALKAMTLWPAWQHFEEDKKGSIEVGKLADFVIISQDPLTIAQEKLAEIKILETIKEDKSIYKLSDKAETVVSSPAMFGLSLQSYDETSIHLNNTSHAHHHGDGCFNEGLSLLYNAIHSVRE